MVLEAGHSLSDSSCIWTVSRWAAYCAMLGNPDITQQLRALRKMAISFASNLCGKQKTEAENTKNLEALAHAV